jgi:hypothetical protein
MNQVLEVTIAFGLERPINEYLRAHPAMELVRIHPLNEYNVLAEFRIIESRDED